MKNRAKCRLCNEILESFHKFDYVSCQCGEIAISGGADAFETSAKNYSNFLRIDDDGNELPVKLVTEGEAEAITSDKAMGRLERIDHVISQLETLPEGAMEQPLTHYDLVNLLRLIRDLISTREKPSKKTKGRKNGKQDDSYQDP